MNNEIKEILDNLKKGTTKESMRVVLNDYGCQLLLDYITNLQEKVEQYENPDDMTLMFMWLDEKAKDKIKQLQEENEFLKLNNPEMNIEHFRIIKENKRKIDNLRKENKRLQDRNIELVLERDRLKEEIENLTHIVANKIIKDYDKDTPLKNQLNKERIKYINLSAVCNDYKSKNEKANTLLDEMLERAYIDGEYIMYDYSTSELLEVKQALQGEDKDVKD